MKYVYYVTYCVTMGMVRMLDVSCPTTCCI